MDLATFSGGWALLLAGLLAVLLGAACGTALGLRIARRQRRCLQRTLARRELDLLELRAEQRPTAKDQRQDLRQKEVLALALRRLGSADNRIATLDGVLEAQERHHASRLADLERVASTARQQAQRAVGIARTAAAHLKRLEAVSGATQTITARDPKSYGSGDAHTVSVVDQHTLTARRNVASRVSNRDSARLSSLAPSNEAAAHRPTALHSIKGMTPALERQLEAAGIRDAEQLATLSDRDADALDRSLRSSVPVASLAQRQAHAPIARRGIPQRRDARPPIA